MHVGQRGEGGAALPHHHLGDGDGAALVDGGVVGRDARDVVQTSLSNITLKSLIVQTPDFMRSS